MRSLVTRIVDNRDLDRVLAGCRLFGPGLKERLAVVPGW